MFRPKRSRTFVAAALLPVFVSSFLLFPVPLQAALPAVSSTVTAPSLNPFATPLTISEAPPSLFRLEKKLNGVATKLVLDAGDLDRVYLLSETSNGQTLTLKYVYDDELYTVTLLLSQVAEGEAPRFTQYYRYALGPNDSLELILEEGWINVNTLNPSRIYDYFAGSVTIRSFDRTGRILKIESSKGSKRILVYSREGDLLTIQEMRSQGDISFFDQIAGGARSWERPLSQFADDVLYVLPTRDSKKRFQPYGTQDPNVYFILTQRAYDVPGELTHHFLLWMEAAHPMRAGPAGGLS